MCSWESTGRELVVRSGANPHSARSEHNSSHLVGRDRWYVVYSQPHREFRAQTQLAAQGFRTFLPRYRKTVRHARKLMTVNAPFFSRYLFVTLDLSRDQWRSIKGTFGVTSLMSDGTLPIPVPQGVIESLINISDADGFVNLGDALQIGERVRVLTGPFADVIGELVRLDGARRVRVLLQLLGGVVAVSVDRNRLAPVRAA
jgi:transcription elongation factor/antiterminator RfaH